jgi:hypothetical protein
MATSYVLDDKFNGSGIAELPMYDNSTDRHVIDLGRQGQKFLAAALTAKIKNDDSQTHYYAVTRFHDNGSIDTAFGKPGSNGVVFGLFKSSSDSGCISIATDGTDSSPIWMLGWSSEQKASPKRLLIATFNRDAKADPEQRYLPQPETNLSLQNGRSNLLIHEDHLVATANFEGLETPPRLYRQSFDGKPGFGDSSFIEIRHPDGKVTLTGLTISKGALLICGYVSKVIEIGFISRYRTDGTLDTTFGEGGTLTFRIDDESNHAAFNTRVQQLCIRSSGEILAAGSRRDGLDGVPDGWVWQLSEAGIPDDTFNSGIAQIAQRENGGVEWKTGMIEQDGGAIFFGTSLYQKLHLQRYGHTGTADPLASPPNEIRDAANAMISFEQDSKILLAANTSGIHTYTGRVIRLLKK